MKKRAYAIVEGTINFAGTGPMVGIVEEGSTGYYPTDFDWGPTDTAKRIAAEMNAELGLDEYEAEAIRIRSIFPKSNVTAAELRGYSIPETTKRIIADSTKA